MAQTSEENKTKLRLSIFDGSAVSFVQIEDFNLQDISAATAIEPIET